MPVAGVFGCFLCSDPAHWQADCPTLIPPADLAEHEERKRTYMQWRIDGRIDDVQKRKLIENEFAMWRQVIANAKERMKLNSTREAIREKLEAAGRNRAVIDAAQWLAYAHLPRGTHDLVDGAVAVSSPYDVSAQVAELAFEMIDILPDSPELTHALRRLIEAKDCLVRAAIAAGDAQ